MSNKTSTPSFSSEQLQASASSALSTVSTLGADEQVSLVEAWVAAGNAAAVDAVAVDSAPAAARKAARRGLNVLKSRGASVPEKHTVARPLAPSQAATVEAWFAPFDPSAQGSSITILRHVVGRDVEVVDVAYNDAGIHRVQGATITGSRRREWETERRRARGYDPVQVSLEWARWRIAQVRQQNALSGLLLPLEFERFSGLLGPAPAADPGHPADKLGLEASADPIRVARSETLHNEPEFRLFLLGNDILQEMLARVGQRIASLGRQPEDQEVSALINNEKGAATDRFFQENIRRQVANQLFDALPSIFHRAGRERALDLLATREAILSAGLITQPPSEIPFLVAFFDKTLAVHIQQNNGQLSIPLPRTNPSAGPVLSQDQLAAIEASRGAPAPSEE